MTDAVTIPDEGHPLGLSAVAWGALLAIAETRMAGRECDDLDGRSMRALERRGLVEHRTSPTLSRVPRHFATLKAYDTIKADRRARGVDDTPKGRITPSKPDLWRGAPADRSRFTAEQVLELDRRRKDHRHVRAVIVSVPVPESELWVPLGQPRPVRRYACPVVGRPRSGKWAGRLAILTPSGQLSSVMPDGTLPASARDLPAHSREAWT